jgi:glutamate racemase
MPHENLVYLADSAHCPYGPRGRDEIRRLCQHATRFLVSRDAKLIVVACNAASAAALGWLRQRFDVPFVGMVPAVKPATSLTQSGIVAVLATRMTARGDLLHEVIHEFADGVDVRVTVGDGLVELVEAGQVDGVQVRQVLELSLGPLVSLGADTVVLGCTHYPFLADAIHQLWPRLHIVDAGPAVARQAWRVLARRGELTRRCDSGHVALFTSGDDEAVSAVVSRLLGSDWAVHPWAVP